MSLSTFGLIFVGVMLNAFAQLSLKAGTNAIGEISLKNSTLFDMVFKISFQPYIVVGLGLYVFSVAIWIVALSKTPVSIAYPMLSIVYVLNVILAYMLFGEAITLQKIIGITIIIIGVYVLAKV